MSGERMRIAIIIPTLGREFELAQTLRGLAGQSRLADEILVVDQNDFDSETIARAVSETPHARRIRSTTKGVCFNMNLGLAETSCDVVLFVDDDVIPSPDLVREHLKVYESDTAGRIGGVAGRVEQARGDLDLEEIEETGRYHSWSGRVVANFNSRRTAMVDIAIGCNMSFRRQPLAQEGGFDLGFSGNAYYFEPDVCLRIKKLGLEICFVPAAELKHLMAPSGGARVHNKALHNSYYVKNAIRLYRRHSPAAGLPFFALWLAFYSSAKSLYNLNPKIALLGVAAVFKGLIQDMSIRSNIQR